MSDEKRGEKGTYVKLWIERYGETRFFGLYDADKNDELVAVFVYKVGALHVKGLLEELEKKLQAAIAEKRRKEIMKDESKSKGG